MAMGRTNKKAAIADIHRARGEGLPKLADCGTKPVFAASIPTIGPQCWQPLAPQVRSLWESRSVNRKALTCNGPYSAATGCATSQAFALKASSRAVSAT